MAFLDNSGDIILDAVLTDAGRFRLAKGDGSFKIVKYAFADDEIDYNKYDKDHASGSAYYDLDILKTPVLEAFTNNTSNMKHKLLSIPRTNLLYLPTIKLNTDVAKGGFEKNADTNQASGFFVVPVDQNTIDILAKAEVKGRIDGFNKNAADNQTITLDQGLDTTEISYTFALDPDLRETRYTVEMDNRLGAITDPNGNIRTPNYIDDDQIASYTFSTGADATSVEQIPAGSNDENKSAIAGPRGTRFKFSIAASIELNSSTFLFTKLGTAAGSFTSDVAYGTAASNGTVYEIDTTVRVVGGSTGRSVDIPVRFLKYVS